MSFMASLGILGRETQVMAFAALGVPAFLAETPEEARSAFRQMLAASCSVIFLTEEWLPVLRAPVARCAEQTLPAVVLLSGAQGQNTARAALEEMIRRAVGTAAAAKQEEENDAG